METEPGGQLKNINAASFGVYQPENPLNSFGRLARPLAIVAAAGVAAIGAVEIAKTDKTDPSNQQTIEASASSTRIATPEFSTAETSKKAASNIRNTSSLAKLAISETRSKKVKDCTTLRSRRDGYHLGFLCRSQGDRYAPVGKQKYNNRVYGVFYEKESGTYKCGYGYRNVLKKIHNLPKKAQNFCEKYQPKFDNRKNFLTQPNCKLVEIYGKKYDACQSGTYSSRIAEKAKGVLRRVYGNFQPKGGPLNATGKKVNHPFTDVRSLNNKVKNISYRAIVKTKASYGKTKAAIVRTNDKILEGGSYGWGYIRASSVPKSERNNRSPLKDELK